MLDALLHVGRGVITTSLALAVGFLAMMTSSWESVRNFGLLSALAILGAAVAVLFVLPALLFGLDALRVHTRGKALGHEAVAQLEGSAK
jgi:predicted RND superfamily exporter protein